MAGERREPAKVAAVLARLERRFAALPAEELAARERSRCPMPRGQHCSSGWHWREDGGQGVAFARCWRAIAARGEAAAAEIPGEQTFESFERMRENDAFKAAKRWADRDASGRRTLAFLRPEALAGTSGCGKTHLLRAAARSLARAGRWVEYVTAGDLTRTMRGRSLFDGTERGVAEIAARRWQRCDALIFDDLGQEETAPPLTASFLAGLLDGREGAPLAFSTHASERELKGRYGLPLVSRLLADAEVPTLRGIDFRRPFLEAV